MTTMPYSRLVEMEMHRAAEVDIDWYRITAERPDELDLVAWVYARLQDGCRVVLGEDTGILALRQTGGSQSGEFAVRTGAEGVYPEHYRSALRAACAAVALYLETLTPRSELCTATA